MVLWRDPLKRIVDVAILNISPNIYSQIGSLLLYGTGYGGHWNDIAVSSTAQEQAETEQHNLHVKCQEVFNFLHCPVASEL